MVISKMNIDKLITYPIYLIAAFVFNLILA